MTNFELFKLKTEHKEQYKEWFVDMVGVIETQLNIKLKDADFKYLLDTYFKQVQEGGN